MAPLYLNAGYFLLLIPAIVLCQESCKEDEALEPLLDAVRVLTAMLSKTETETDKEPGTEISRNGNVLMSCLWCSTTSLNIGIK